MALASVLVLNAGSSSLKASVIEVGRRDPVAAAAASWGSEASAGAARRATVSAVLDGLWASGASRESITAVGHRVVHGGLRFREPTPIDETVLAELDELGQLAPLHNPIAVDTIRIARELLPNVRHIAVFDTAFHASIASW